MNKILFAASALALSAQIQAAGLSPCTKADLNGNYAMYQNSVALANLHIGSCHVNIQNGVASGSCAFTTTSNGTITPGFSGAVTGTAVMNTNCSAEMQLNFSPAPNVTVQSFFDMQFSPDKQSFIGGWTNNFGLLGTSAGTRYSTVLPATPAP